MNKNLRIVFSAIVLALVAYLMYYFANIVIYILIAAILAFVGHPLVRLLDRVHYKRFSMPRGLSSFLALFAMILVLAGFVGGLIPVVAQQAQVISSIDVTRIGNSLQQPLLNLENYMMIYGLLDPGQTIESILNEQLQHIVSLLDVSSVIRNLLGLTGSVFIGVFAVMFITFFFLKDEKMLSHMILLLVPERYQRETRNILHKSKNLLSRYFIGLMFELLSMMTLISVTLHILGVRNALLIGFLGGLMNIIPYLGPVIGAVIGVLIGVSSALGLGIYDGLLLLVAEIMCVFGGANLIDNMLLQPFIYSTSVKAHPLEIFLVILIAGSAAGILGMVFAIPAYTVLRIVAKEFLNRIPIIRKITENI